MLAIACGFLVNILLRAKLHYTETGYEHRLRTPPTDKLQQICHISMPEPNISTRQDVRMWQIFVRWWCSLVVFVAGVRVVEFGSYRMLQFLHSLFQIRRLLLLPSRDIADGVRPTAGAPETCKSKSISYLRIEFTVNSAN